MTAERNGGLPPPPPPPDPSQAGVRVPWRPLEAVPVFILANVATLALVAIAAALIADREVEGVAAAALFHVATAGTVVLWLHAVHPGSLPALGLPVAAPREAVRGLIGGLVTRALAMFAVAPLVVLAWQLVTGRTPSVPDQIPTEVGIGPAVGYAAVAILAAPVSEELFFRGLLFRSLRSRFAFWPAALISGLAFGAVHVVDGSWFFVPIMFFVGIAFAWLYDRWNRILVPIAAHATFNVVGVTLLYTLG